MRLAALAAAVGLSGSVVAMTVQPIVINLPTSGRGMTQVVTVENTFANPLPVEIRVEELSLEDDGVKGTGKDSGDLLVFPPQAMIQPGQTQTFRMQYVGDPDLAKSQALSMSPSRSCRCSCRRASRRSRSSTISRSWSASRRRAPSPTLKVSAASLGHDKAGKPVPVVTLSNASHAHGYLSQGRLADRPARLRRQGDLQAHAFRVRKSSRRSASAWSARARPARSRCRSSCLRTGAALRPSSLPMARSASRRRLRLALLGTCAAVRSATAAAAHAREPPSPARRPRRRKGGSSSTAASCCPTGRPGSTRPDGPINLTVPAKDGAALSRRHRPHDRPRTTGSNSRPSGCSTCWPTSSIADVLRTLRGSFAGKTTLSPGRLRGVGHQHPLQSAGRSSSQLDIASERRASPHRPGQPARPRADRRLRPAGGLQRLSERPRQSLDYLWDGAERRTSVAGLLPRRRDPLRPESSLESEGVWPPGGDDSPDFQRIGSRARL